MEIAPYSLPPIEQPTPFVEVDVLPEIKINDPPPDIAPSSLMSSALELEVLEELPPTIPDTFLEDDPFALGKVTLGPGPDRIAVAETEPLVIKRVVPAYPSLAREAGAEGTVKVQVTVDRLGRVVAARVVESDTIQSLRAAALEAAYGYLFSPAKQQGHPVPAHVYLTFEFTLR
jgi:protein TonB